MLPPVSHGPCSHPLLDDKQNLIMHAFLSHTSNLMVRNEFLSHQYVYCRKNELMNGGRNRYDYCNKAMNGTYLRDLAIIRGS